MSSFKSKKDLYHLGRPTFKEGMLAKNLIELIISIWIEKNVVVKWKRG